MREDDGIDLSAREPACRANCARAIPWSLEKSAIDQNLKTLLPERSPVLIRCFEPVTVPAAPRNWM